MWFNHKRKANKIPSVSWLAVELVLLGSLGCSLCSLSAASGLSLKRLTWLTGNSTKWIICYFKTFGCIHLQGLLSLLFFFFLAPPWCSQCNPRLQEAHSPGPVSHTALFRFFFFFSTFSFKGLSPVIQTTPHTHFMTWHTHLTKRHTSLDFFQPFWRCTM